MIGRAVADIYKARLEGISGWTGRVYIYLKDWKTEEELLDNLTETGEGKRINVWFITRTNLATLRYGQSGRWRIAQNQRVKLHTFQIKGLVSVFEDPGEVLTSEERFQELCDSIDTAFAAPRSLGITERTVVEGSLSMTIGYQQFAKFGVHAVTMRIDVAEFLAVTYTN